MSVSLVQSLALASGGLFSIGSILIVVILLGTERGFRRASGYVAGYMGTYAFIGALVLTIGSWVSLKASSEGKPWGSIVLYILTGCMLFFFFQKRLRSKEKPGEIPGFLLKLQTMSTRKALWVGMLVAVINLKNLAIFLSSLEALLKANLPLYSGLLFLVVVLLTFFGSTLAPLVLYLVFTHSFDRILSAMRSWLERNNRSFSLVLLFCFGCFFWGKAITRLLQ